MLPAHHQVLLPGGGARPAGRRLSHPWEGVAILGGAFAFLLAGLVLRKGRRSTLPAA